MLELTTARIYLRSVDVIGQHARTLGMPRIVNLGRMEFGSAILIRSVIVRAELGTGPKGMLKIGEGVRVNYGASIYAHKEVVIGDRVRIGPYVSIADTDFHDTLDREITPRGQAVRIGNDVLLGRNAMVLKGVTIGEHSIVGAGSVVTHDVRPFTIVAGVPARQIGMITPLGQIQKASA